MLPKRILCSQPCPGPSPAPILNPLCAFGSGTTTRKAEFSPAATPGSWDNPRVELPRTKHPQDSKFQHRRQMGDTGCDQGKAAGHQHQEKSQNPGSGCSRSSTPGSQGTLTLGWVSPGLPQTQLRREGRNPGRLSREGNHHQQPENSSQHWESPLPAISRTWSGAGEMEHPEGTDPTDPTAPRWALKGPRGAGSTACPLPEPGLGVPSSSALLGLSLSPLPWPLLCLGSLPSGKITGGGSRCCFLNTQSQQEPIPMATRKDLPLEGAAQQNRKIQELPRDEMETMTTGSKFSVVGST